MATPTAAEQITELSKNLAEARAEAYEARLAMKAAEKRIVALKNALQGAALGQRLEQERAATAQAEADNEE